MASVVPIGFRIRRRHIGFLPGRTLSTKKILFPGAGLEDVDGRENALIRDLAIKDESPSYLCL